MVSMIEKKKKMKKDSTNIRNDYFVISIRNRSKFLSSDDGESSKNKFHQREDEEWYKLEEEEEDEEEEEEEESEKIQLLPRGKVHRPEGTAKCRQGVDSSTVAMVTVAGPGVAKRSVTKASRCYVSSP